MGDFQGSDFGGGTGVLAPPAPPARRRSISPPDSLPPDFGDEGGGGGGGGGDGSRGPSPEDPSSRDAASFALGLALAGISTLFLVFLSVWMLLRRSAPEWPPAGAPEPPQALWLSTVLLLVASLALVRATRTEEADERRTWLGRSLLLGLGFLCAQVFLWYDLAGAGLLPSSNGYGAIFYSLTGLHALHVAGGLAYLGWLWAWGGPDGTPGRHSTRLCARYWHFMGGIWVVLFAVLYFVP